MEDTKYAPASRASDDAPHSNVPSLVHLALQELVTKVSTDDFAVPELSFVLSEEQLQTAINLVMVE